MARVAFDALFDVAARALRGAGANEDSARSTAYALVVADAQGLGSHGVSRIPQYVAHLRQNRVDGAARPFIVSERGGVFLVDANDGFAFPALELAVEKAISKASSQGIVLAGIRNSHHFGAAAYHLRPVARAGLIGLLFGNSPAAIPAWGGKRAIFGTNPIAAVFPRREGEPLVIDLSLSEVARGKLLVAQKEGREIPLGWALDRSGNPTRDPTEGLAGMMCPAGGLKGALLAMIVELLCVGLTASAFGFEADSFFVDEGNRPKLGQALIVIDPGAASGRDSYLERIELLIATMLQDDSVRLPGERRRASEIRAEEAGIEVPDALLTHIRQLAQTVL